MGKKKRKKTSLSLHWGRKYFHSLSSFQLQIALWLGMVSFVPTSPFPWWYFTGLHLCSSCECSPYHCGFICVSGLLLLILCLLFMEMIFPWSCPSHLALRNLMHSYLHKSLSLEGRGLIRHPIQSLSLSIYCPVLGLWRSHYLLQK